MVNATVNLTKDEIKSFLDGLLTRIVPKTADANEVQKGIRRHPAFIHKGSKTEWCNWELAFVDQIVLECLSDYVEEYVAQTAILSSKLPSDLILAESSQGKNNKTVCGTPAWSQGHPFNKAVGSSLNDLYKRWGGNDPKKRKAVFPAVCPDVALLAPFRVVFECKYFNQPAKQPAASQLVSGLYQSFFYRAMPTKSPGTGGLTHGWDYEYACFVAYDATPNRRLKKAWDALNEGTRIRFWDDANIYVMILPQ